MYYNVQDLIDITGLSQNKCYEMIRELNKSFKKEYPYAVLSQGHIPKWWFEQCMGLKREEKEVQDEKEEIKN